MGGLSVVVGRGRVWRTWAGSQWSVLLKMMSGAGGVGQMGGGRRIVRRQASECHCQLPRRARLAKGGHTGGMMRAGAE